METSPLEITEYLAYRVSRDYALMRIKCVTYHEDSDELVTVFLFDEGIKDKLDKLKIKLQQDYKASVGQDVKYIFKYEQSYMDDILLAMKVRSFLRSTYSVLTLELDDDDVTVRANKDGFTVNISLPKHTTDFVNKSKAFADFKKDLEENHFYVFNFFISAKDDIDEGDVLEKLDKYVQNTLPDKEVRADKTLKVKNIEYFFGKPIKERPIKIEFLKVSSSLEQIIAGTISYLTKREFTRKGKDGEEDEQRPYWTFVLDDGHTKVQCIYFGRVNMIAKFEKLVNGTVICVMGINSERNGRVGFNVSGVSFCTMIQ